MAKILVVDDEVLFLELMKGILEEEGFEVATACNEEEFRDSVLSEKPALIILDIMLGGKTGPFIYDDLLAKGMLARSIPVIFISGLMQDRLPTKPVMPGQSYALCAKPFESQALLKDIHTLIKAEAV